MSILHLENVNHGFGDRCILKDVSFRLLKGEHVGLIGANGEGKSTFMDIITKKLQPDKGKITWSNKLKIGYMDQHVKLKKGKSIKDILKEAFQYLFDFETEMNILYKKATNCSEKDLKKILERTAIIQDLLLNNDFYRIDSKIEEIAKGIGILELGLDKDVYNLSGGQRTKVLLAKLLLENPDILLLDEPTNYLDEENIKWLNNYLQSYENAFILISHDITFLNSVVNLIYHIEDKKLTRYVGNYNEFKKIYLQNKKKLEGEYDRQKKKIAKLEHFIARTKANLATSNMAKSRKKQLDKMQKIELIPEKNKPQFKFKSAKASSKIIFSTKNLVIGYTKQLTKPLNLYMERGQKIVFTGANGIGKTTLINTLLGKIKPLSGYIYIGDYQYIGYFEQEDKKNNNNTCVEEIWNEFPGFTQGEIRSNLAKCGISSKNFDTQVKVLSGGEAAKVRLCKIINKETNILILDEPTNHLDPESREILKMELKNYKGSIILVSHDIDFYKDIATNAIDCQEWIFNENK